MIPLSWFRSHLILGSPNATHGMLPLRQVRFPMCPIFFSIAKQFQCSMPQRSSKHPISHCLPQSIDFRNSNHPISSNFSSNHPISRKGSPNFPQSSTSIQILRFFSSRPLCRHGTSRISPSALANFSSSRASRWARVTCRYGMEILWSKRYGRWWTSHVDRLRHKRYPQTYNYNRCRL